MQVSVSKLLVVVTAILDTLALGPLARRQARVTLASSGVDAGTVVEKRGEAVKKQEGNHLHVPRST